MAKTPVTMRMEQEEKQKLEMLAEKRNLSLSDYIRRGLQFYTSFPPDLMNDLERLSKALHFPVETVVAHKLIRQMAFDATWQTVIGEWRPGYNREFRIDGKGLVTGERLFKLLCDKYEAAFFKAKEVIAEESERSNALIEFMAEL